MTNQIDPRQIIQAVQRGANPNRLMMQMIQSDPVMYQAAQLISGKTPQQIQSMVQQRAQQIGVDLNQLAQQWGVRLPR